MNLTAKQQQIVSMIDNWVHGILWSGGGNDDIHHGMNDYMEDFKYLMDTLNKREIYILCNRYEGFCHFTKILETRAEA